MSAVHLHIIVLRNILGKTDNPRSHWLAGPAGTSLSQFLALTENATISEPDDISWQELLLHTTWSLDLHLSRFLEFFDVVIPIHVA